MKMAAMLSLPNFPEINQPCTDGVIYAEAAQQGQEIIESLSLWYQPEGKNCIHPRTLKA